MKLEIDRSVLSLFFPLLFLLPVCVTWSMGTPGFSSTQSATGQDFSPVLDTVVASTSVVPSRPVLQWSLVFLLIVIFPCVLPSTRNVLSMVTYKVLFSLFQRVPHCFFSLMCHSSPSRLCIQPDSPAQMPFAASASLLSSPAVFLLAFSKHFNLKKA